MANLFKNNEESDSSSSHDDDDDNCTQFYQNEIVRSQYNLPASRKKSYDSQAKLVNDDESDLGYSEDSDSSSSLSLPDILVKCETDFEFTQN